MRLQTKVTQRTRGGRISLVNIGRLTMYKVFVLASFLLVSPSVWASDGVSDSVVKKETKEAYSRCKLVSEELKQQWLYYDDFKINQIAFSTGGGWGPGGIDINHYECTISAVSSGGDVKKVRVNISQRSDSNKFQWKIRHDYPIDDCTELYIGDCPGFRNK